MDFRHKDVVLVANNASMRDGTSLVPNNQNSSLLYLGSSIIGRSKWMWATSWMCSIWDDTSIVVGRRQPWCSQERLLPQVDSWAVKNYQLSPEGNFIREIVTEIDYCLTAGDEDTQAGCAIRYSSVLLLVVIGLNFVKLACVWLVWRIHAPNKQNGREHEPLVTQGDAIASFLSLEDPSTKHLPFLEAPDCAKKWLSATKTPYDRELAIKSRFSRLRHRIRWYQSIAVTHWLASVSS